MPHQIAPSCRDIRVSCNVRTRTRSKGFYGRNTSSCIRSYLVSIFSEEWGTLVLSLRKQPNCKTLINLFPPNFWYTATTTTAVCDASSDIRQSYFDKMRPHLMSNGCSEYLQSISDVCGILVSLLICQVVTSS